MIILRGLLIMALFLLIGMPTEAHAVKNQVDGAQGIYFRDAKLVGKLVAVNPDRGILIVYGNISVHDDLGWKTVKENKFTRVTPSVDWVKEEIEKYLDGGVTLYGSYNAMGSQIEEMFRATKVETAANYPHPVNENWIGFGKTLQTLNTAKFNINEVTDFVDVLAAGRDAMAGMDVEKKEVEYTSRPGNKQTMAESVRFPGNKEERERRQRMINWWNSNWNFKWLVEKDINTYNKAQRSVGGSSFYVGQLGYANTYLIDVPVIRPDINSFMENAQNGGGFVEESGPAVFFANIYAVREEEWPHMIIKLTASGPLFESPKELVYGILNNSAKSQTWRLEGWNSHRAEILAGKRCWLSGSRVLVYETNPKTGETYLVDYYFSVHKTLTQDEFNSMLDLQRELISQGGF